MDKILTIARYEYGRHVRTRAFLLTALGVPLFAVAVFGIIFLVASGSRGEQRLGLVDPSGRFAAVDVQSLDLRRPIPIESLADEAAARRAFDAGTVDAYIMIPADYLQTGQVQAVGRRRLTERAQNEVRAVLEAGVLASVPAANRARLAEPDALKLRTLASGREVDADNFLLFLLPYAFALLFFITTFTTSGYLLRAVSEEKEDRVGEILAVTVAPRQMMAGKILGLSGVGLTQMLIWIGLAVIAVAVFASDLSLLRELRLPWSLAGLALLYFLLGYLLIAACFAIAGAAVPTPQEAQTLVTPISMLSLAPLLLTTVILAKPSGTLALIFSLIPFSAPMTMLMRLPLTDIPAWQIAASLLGLLVTAIGAVLLSGRVLRLGMLRYGKRLGVRELFSAGATVGD